MASQRVHCVRVCVCVHTVFVRVYVASVRG